MYKNAKKYSPNPEKFFPVVIYTDGACAQNPGGAGGWAYISIIKHYGEIKDSGGEESTTSNRMELTAILEGLKRIEHPQRIAVFSDSKYSVNSLNDWIHGWQKKDWIKGDGEEVKNRDLFEALYAIITFHDVRLFWIKGHNGNFYNEMADQMATAEIKYFTPSYQLN